MMSADMRIDLLVEDDCLVVRLWAGTTELSSATLTLAYLAHMTDVAKMRGSMGRVLGGPPKTLLEMVEENNRKPVK